MDLELAGKKAIVTGGTKGIGLEIARTFADEGADVAICARDESQVEAVVADLVSRGVSAFGGAVDVGDAPAYTAWLRSAIEQLGGLDAFVANVSALAIGYGENVWEECHRVDLMHTVRGCLIAAEHLKLAADPAIVIVSSVSAVMTDSGTAVHAYGAFKAALVSYGGQLAQELARDGVRVNVVCPGPIEFAGGFWDRIHQGDPPLYAATQRSVALRRLGRPKEVARGVVFLASPASSFTTGANLRIDGGSVKTADF